MARIITTEKINEIRFYQIPKAFFHNPLYIGMKNESKIAYAILRDLLSLSLENNWVNDKNEVYVKLSRDKMMTRLGIKGTAKYAEIMKELIDKELIVKRRVGLKQVDETYVCLPEELSVVYSDAELLELENTDVALKFENQTSRSLKIKPQEVRKSNLKKFENQTHINTNYINTNYIDTNYNISSKSKGDKSPQAIRFESIINKSLGTSTLNKFENYVSKYDVDFIEAILDYAEETGARSYSWFNQVINKYIAKGMLTREEVETDIENYRDEARQAKNRALKDKDYKKNLDKAIEMAQDRQIEEVANQTIDISNGVEIEEVKELIKDYVTDVVYNTWIAPSKLLKVKDDIILACPNELTRNVINRAYIDTIHHALKENGFSNVIVAMSND